MEEAEKPKIGVCFSGGGIRSAAFCSGVLKRLLDKNVPINYISTVSGGGYIGSSLMDWAAKEEGGWGSVGRWKERYFKHLMTHFGLYINWQAGRLEIFGDILMLLLIGALVAVVLPLMQATAVIIPTAMVIRSTIGTELVRLIDCSNGTHTTGSSAPTDGAASTTVCFLSTDKIAFIASAVIIIIVCGFISRTLDTVLLYWCTKSNRYHAVRLAGVLLIPLTQAGLWFIMYHALMACFALIFEDLTKLFTSDEQLSDAATIVQIAFVVLVALFWVQLPLSPLKNQISTVVLLMIMARVVQFWCFRWDEPHVRSILEVLTYIAAFTLISMPIIGHAKFNLLFFYNRYVRGMDLTRVGLFDFEIFQTIMITFFLLHSSVEV